MLGSAVLTTEMSRTTRIWAARATTSSAQDARGPSWSALLPWCEAGSCWAVVWDIGTPQCGRGVGGVCAGGWADQDAVTGTCEVTATTTARMAATVALAPCGSSSSPGWVEVTSRRRLL